MIHERPQERKLQKGRVSLFPFGEEPLTPSETMCQRYQSSALVIPSMQHLDDVVGSFSPEAAGGFGPCLILRFLGMTRRDWALMAQGLTGEVLKRREELGLGFWVWFVYEYQRVISQ